MKTKAGNKKKIGYRSKLAKLGAVEQLEWRRLLTVTPIWSEPILIQDGINEVIYVEGRDIDFDGDDDAIAAGPNVLLFESLGDGSFAEPVALTSDDAGYGMTLARDMDNDGDLDLVASSAQRGIIIMKNHGDGTFAAEQVATDATGIIRMVVADLDGDGDSDIVSGSYSEKRLAWHMNQGDGSFAPQVVIAQDIEGLFSVDAGDLDGDNMAEIVTAEFGENNSVAIYKSDGNGFVRSTISNDLNAPLAVEIADLDGDGDQDVAAGAYYGNSVVWYANDGAGNFDAESELVTDNVGGPYRLRATDWDNDADLDLVSVSTSDDKVAFHENLGGGVFAQQVVLFDNWSGPTAGSPADIDGDGDADLLVASYADDALLWVRNDTVRQDERFQSAFVIANELDGVFVVDAVDLNNDGHLDVLAAVTSDSQVVWAANDGAGGFGEVKLIGTESGSPLFAGAFDLDSDGDLDVVSASSFNADEISWYENDGSGSFSSQKVIDTGLGQPRWLDAADVDHDGDLDLLAAINDDDRYIWYANRLNEASNDFQLGGVIHDGEGEGANKIFAIDMDQDGDVDVMTGSSTPGGPQPIAWYENDGLGNFVTRHSVTESTTSSWYVRPADLDNDGDIDVVASSFVGPIVWYEQLSDGTFSDAQVISTAADASYGLDVSDLDGDGDVDVVSGSYADNEIAWYENNGDGSFSGQQVISQSQSGPFSVVAADLDGDGDEDVLAASYYDDTVAWYENEAVEELPALRPSIDKYVTNEHVDVAFNFRSGQWHASVDVDEADGTEQEYETDEVVLFALPEAREQRPEGAQWDFTGIAEGDNYWVLPQHRDSEILYPGIAVANSDNGTFARYFEADPRIRAERDWVRFQLVDVRAPEGGQFGVYETTTFEGETIVKTWMTTADGISNGDAFWQREGGHSHANFFFTQPGVYEVDLRGSGFIDVNGNRTFDPGLDVYSESEVATFYFAVETPNHAPTVSVPGLLSSEAGLPVVFDGGNAVSISDVERDGGDYEVRLAAKGGLLNLTDDQVDLVEGDGHDDEVLRLRGTLADINEALTTLQFAPAVEFQGLATIQLLVEDGGFFHPDLNGDGVLDNAMSTKATLVIGIDSPAPDFNTDGVVNSLDIDAVCRAALDGDQTFDLNDDQELDLDDVVLLVDRVFESTIGDVNLDGRFDSSDLIATFQAGKYDDPSKVANWAEGDWNCDGVFDTADLIFAFQQGEYIQA